VTASAEDLGDLGEGGRLTGFGRTVALTHLGKLLFPGRGGEPPVTKREFIGYAIRIAPVLLPYLAGRPISTPWSGTPGRRPPAIRMARAMP
jgi:bifunctional non-homologous end joining protein LigD